MRLFELFNTTTNWQQIHDSHGLEIYQASIGDDVIELSYQYRGSNDETYEVSFHRNSSAKKTGEGNAPKIFGAVINHIFEWVKNNQPDLLIFSGSKSVNDVSRVNLYSRMVGRYAKKLGYRVEKEDLDTATYFYLIKNKPDA